MPHGAILECASAIHALTIVKSSGIRPSTTYFRWERRLTAFLPGCYMCLIVSLDTVQKFLPALRMPDVLDTDVDPLFDVAVANNFVDNYANSIWRNIVNDARSAESCEREPVSSRAEDHDKYTHPW